MAKYIAAYIATLIVMAAIDAVWLGVMANALYRPTLGDMLLPTFSPAPAVLFYLMYVAGIVIFAISPAFASGRWTTALVKGALFGLFAYGTYDLTNMATLKNWTLQLTVADMFWGTSLTGVSAALGTILPGLVLGTART